MKEAPSSSSKSCRRCCYPRVAVEDLTTILHRILSPMVSIVATPLRRSSRERKERSSRRKSSCRNER
ncbi:hypothetical protein C1H46_003128 [Malus baccata]|uniref:Uncharacterized protein n=1 Tax=Malus baccata TaxID=106549 RepID=A0A540NJ90_MALBA|nr:hypothetical protein C1H46_003128 [Malus baccata]